MNFLARLDPGDAVVALVFIFLVQTSVVILLAALWSRILLRRRAEARHALWLGVLAVVVVSPVVAAVAQQTGFALWAIAQPVAGHAASPTLRERRPSHQGLRADSSRLTAEVFAGSVAAEAEPQHEAVSVRPIETAQPDTLRATTTASSRGGNVLTGELTLLWAVGVFVGVARIAAGWTRMAALCRSALALDPVRYGSTLERVGKALGVAVLPPVFTSPEIRGPVAVGLLRPRVILPNGMAESNAGDSLREVLVHECAHVLRLDAWVGLLQRLAGAIFWPHLLVHFASGQLTRAREELCDNHVLRCSDPRGYARTLLTLTEQCWPLVGIRPGLGLLGARWALADRVAGILDARRRLMTRPTLRMKVTVGISLAATALAAWGIQLDRTARAGESSDNAVDTKATAPDRPKDGVWAIEGVVVDEQGNPVAGAVVHAREQADAAGVKTGANGEFTLWAGHGPMYTRELVAEIDGGARMGRVQFTPPRQYTAQGSVRLVLKPARTVMVRVKDSAGGPISGAAVEAFDYAYQFHATTSPAGVAGLRVPADARIPGVIALKSGAGFDYFENYRTNPPSPEFDFPALPAEITLTLDGARTVKVKVLDPTGRPVPGVEVKPFRPQKAGKIQTIEIARGATSRATTDEQGIAKFDWLPKTGSNGDQSGAVTFLLTGPQTFSAKPTVRARGTDRAHGPAPAGSAIERLRSVSGRQPCPRVARRRGPAGARMAPHGDEDRQ